MSISKMAPNCIVIYTDGCRKKSGAGGWSAIIVSPKFIKLFGGFEKETTNNRMELDGPIHALSAITQIKCRKIVVSDSQYVVNGFNIWMKNWIRKGWRLKNNDPVKNPDRWAKLWDLRDETKFVWVKGHDGHRENEACDLAANICCKNNLTINESFSSIDELEYYLSTYQEIKT